MNQLLALGETLWDVFPDGPRFGGAPANYAMAVARLADGQCQIALATAVGNDLLGDQAIDYLRSAGVSDAFIARSEQSTTGQVIVSLDSKGHPSYRFAPSPAWDHIPWSEKLAAYAAHAQVITFGTLAQREPPSRSTIQRVLRENSGTATIRLLDMNLRTPYWDETIILQSLDQATVLKLNDEELPDVTRAVGLSGSDESILQGLFTRYPLELIALTRGSRGSLLVERSGRRSELPGRSLQVVDTVGAGDAFTAALSLGLVYRLPLNRLHAWAAVVAEYVCTQAGATPEIPDSLTLSEVLSQP